MWIAYLHDPDNLHNFFLTCSNEIIHNDKEGNWPSLPEMRFPSFPSATADTSKFHFKLGLKQFFKTEQQTYRNNHCKWETGICKQTTSLLF